MSQCIYSDKKIPEIASNSKGSDLEYIQRKTFKYFLQEANPLNGLVIDKTAQNWPARIAATGLALASYPVGVERAYISRSDAVSRTLATLRFFWNSPQGTECDASGYQGFYYDMAIDAQLRIHPQRTKTRGF